MNLWNFDLLNSTLNHFVFVIMWKPINSAFGWLFFFWYLKHFTAYWIPMETVSCHWVLIWRSMHHFKYPRMPNWSLLELICMKLNQWASASEHLKVRVHNWDHIINSGTSSHSFFGYVGIGQLMQHIFGVCETHKHKEFIDISSSSPSLPFATPSPCPHSLLW